MEGHSRFPKNNSSCLVDCTMSAQLICRKSIPNQTRYLRSQCPDITDMAHAKAQSDSAVIPSHLKLCQYCRATRGTPWFLQLLDSLHVAASCRATPGFPRLQVTCHCTHVQRVPRVVKSHRHLSAPSAPLARLLGFRRIRCATAVNCAFCGTQWGTFPRASYGNRGHTRSAPHDLPLVNK